MILPPRRYLLSQKTILLITIQNHFWISEARIVSVMEMDWQVSISVHQSLQTIYRSFTAKIMAYCTKMTLFRSGLRQNASQISPDWLCFMEIRQQIHLLTFN